MSILVLTPELESKISTLREFAEARENWRDVGVNPPVIPGDVDDYVAFVPVGYKLVYSIDTEGTHALRHLSVSRELAEGVPGGIDQMSMLVFCRAFGFTDQAQVGLTEGDPPWVVHAIESFPVTS